MSDEASLIPLKRTRESLEKISSNLAPFLDLLDRYYNQNDNSNGDRSGSSTPVGKKEGKRENIDKQKVTEAEAAVALAIGTLRYMAARLKGSAKGQKKNDPLRLELDKMRKTLVALKKLDKQTDSNDKKRKGDATNSPSPKDEKVAKKNEGSASKRKRPETNNSVQEPKSRSELSSPNPKSKKKLKKSS